MCELVEKLFEILTDLLDGLRQCMIKNKNRIKRTQLRLLAQYGSASLGKRLHGCGRCDPKLLWLNQAYGQSTGDGVAQGDSFISRGRGKKEHGLIRLLNVTDCPGNDD